MVSNGHDWFQVATYSRLVSLAKFQTSDREGVQVAGAGEAGSEQCIGAGRSSC